MSKKKKKKNRINFIIIVILLSFLLLYSSQKNCNTPHTRSKVGNMKHNQELRFSKSKISFLSFSIDSFCVLVGRVEEEEQEIGQKKVNI